jgi:pimeloyl-ACP methyl ester carboxylesterase
MIPLVFLPGLLHDERLWTHQRTALAGLAETSVADLTRDDSLAGMAARVLAVAPPTFALAGLSMGGYVALEILRQAPARVDRLALLDTTARPDTPEQTRRRRDAVALAESGGFAKIMPALLPLLLHPDHLGDSALAGLARDMAMAVGPAAFARQQAAIIGRPDARPGLAAIACPTLVAVGADDQLTPLDRAREMAAAIPGARLAVFEHCGHLSAMEQPAAVNAALRDWLLS